jgi:hypothetical protein
LARLDRDTSVLPVTTFQTAQDVETYPEAGSSEANHDGDQQDDRTAMLSDAAVSEPFGPERVDHA